ncbi:MAG: sigma-54-dependent Fis family transcriptional regulator, partial [Clostridiales bacterium]|nr:sigma-54-dependent Fis family transcriptional regulator [Clostridiales bacterium]
NIRELKNIIERYVIMKRNGIKDLGLPISANCSQNEEKINEDDFELKYRMMVTEKKFIVNALKKANYNQTKAAKLLKIPRTTLIYKIEKHRIKVGI